MDAQSDDPSATPQEAQVPAPSAATGSPYVIINMFIIENNKKENVSLTEQLFKVLAAATVKCTGLMMTALGNLFTSCGAMLEGVTHGSVTLVVRIMSREGLNKLWSMYTTGELARKLTKILITNELTTEDKSGLVIQATILESDYEQASRFFDELEKDQQKAATGQGDVAISSPATKSTSPSPSPIPSTQASDSPQQTENIAHIGTASGSHDPVIVGASPVVVSYKVPLEGPGMETVDEKSLLKLADELKGEWPEVAEHLGFADDDCESIRVAYPENMKEQAWQMLKALRERHDGLVKMGEVKGALKKINRYDLLKLLGEDFLERTTIRKIARGLGESWPKLALNLQVDEVQCEAIKEYNSEPWQQAEEMLVLWREDFKGENPVNYLGRALMMMMVHEDLALECVSSQQLQPCGRCGNANPLKMRRYYSKDYEGFTRVIGLCCASCGQEWLSERFLFHPDVDNTRPWVKLGGVVLKEQLEVPVEKNPVFQLKDCRTKIEYFHDMSNYLKVGDHITWHRPYGIWHHAVVSGLSDEVGKVKVIHWHKPNCSITAQIVEEELDLRKQRGDLFRIDYPDEITTANTAELVIARAESRKGDIGYHLFGDNCEAFASYCKTGVAESCQLDWLRKQITQIVGTKLAEIADGVKVGFSYVREIANCGLAEGGKEAMTLVGEAELIERFVRGSNWIGVGFVFVFEGYACYWDLRVVYEKRRSGGISLKDFIETASQRVSQAICSAGLASLIGIGLLVVRGGLGSFILPGIGAPIGAFLGSVVGGTLGLIIGKPLGSIVGPQIGLAITSAMGTNDKAVERIEDLKPGDQVVFYGKLLHPRHHVIVVDQFPGSKKVQVVHNTYKQGVVEEKVDFFTPVFRLVYDERKCYPPDEVIQRARSKIGDETYRYSLAWNNCKYFARWCKLK